MHYWRSYTYLIHFDELSTKISICSYWLVLVSLWIPNLEQQKMEGIQQILKYIVIYFFYEFFKLEKYIKMRLYAEGSYLGR